MTRKPAASYGNLHFTIFDRQLTCFEKRRQWVDDDNKNKVGIYETLRRDDEIATPFFTSNTLR